MSTLLTIISTGEAAIQTPKMEARIAASPISPFAAKLAVSAPIKEKLVPCIHNNPHPTGPKRRHCINVEIPDASKAMETRNPVVSALKLSALDIISGGVTIATKIASRCWKPANMASLKGGLSSI